MKARAASRTSASVKWPGPTVNSSRNSRAKFSFGLLLAIARPPSSQMSIAGSTTIAVSKAAKPPSAVLAEHRVLPVHGREPPYLRDAGGEIAVPEERQLLAERVGAEDDPVEPGGLEPVEVVSGDRRATQDLEHDRLVGGRRGRVEETRDALSRPRGQVALQLGPGGAEAGSRGADARPYEDPKDLRPRARTAPTAPRRFAWLPPVQFPLIVKAGSSRVSPGLTWKSFRTSESIEMLSRSVVNRR